MTTINRAPAPLLIAQAPVGASSPALDLALLPALANRHGLITGATGTGKTVTLQRLAEGFSRIGVPVFMADVKGDLSGLCKPGQPGTRLRQRIDSLQLPWNAAACPVSFWDVFGRAGHPVRATMSDLGPLLLARMLGLNEVQEGVLNLVFRIADDQHLLLLDLKDLRALLQHVADNAKNFQARYGNVASASVGAIQRELLALENQGAEQFFGEPMLDISDLMRQQDGQGVINILAAEQLMQSPRLYATFLLWMLSELFQQLPEAGDLDKPKIAFFFDEAHLLFKDAPDALLDKIEQVVRLIRSKGVGIYFVTQNPLDIPDSVLGQLGNRVQHALRAFTPRDQKAVKAAASTMRPNPGLDIEAAITELAVGEALVSLLDEQGRPGITQRALICPPESQVGPIDAAERQRLIQASPLQARYAQSIDRESAYERLHGRTADKSAATDTKADIKADTKAETNTHTDASAAGGGAQPGGVMDSLGELLLGSTGPRGAHRDGLLQTAAKSAVRAMASQAGREILRGVLGGLLGSARKR